MKVEDLKTSLDLINTLIKLREISVLFNEQVEAFSDKSGIKCISEVSKFNAGIFECMDSIGTMIGESAVNGVCSLIPDKD